MAQQPTQPDRPLIIADGGLPGLVSIAIASEAAVSGATNELTAPPGVVWATVPDIRQAAHLGKACSAAAAGQAESYGLEYAGIAGVSPDLAAGGLGGAGQYATSLLTRACYLAASKGCRRVVWPAAGFVDADEGGHDLDAIAAAIDRALLVGRLVSLDLDEPGVTIETPFVDLTDPQIADLARDLDVPAESCWWWGGKTADLPGAEAQAQRWMHLLGLGGSVEVKTGVAPVSS